MALVADDHKLVSYDYGRSWQLYDLASDPSETTDIAAANGELVSSLRDDLLAWFDDTMSSREGRDYGRD